MIQLPPNATGTILQTSVPAVGTAITAPTYQAGEVQEVALAPSGKRAYRASFTALALGTGATTVCAQVTGSATKVVKVTKVAFSATQATAAVYMDVQLVKSSTAISGGTPSAGTAVPLDSGFPVTTVGAIQGFTAGPTAGTLVGIIAAKKVFAPITGTPANGPSIAEWDLSKYPVVLHGVAESLDVKINGVTPANAPLADIEFEWTEE